MAKVAIIGGAGYLGSVLANLLVARQHSVTAITRQNGEILLDPEKINILPYQQVSDTPDKYDVVINLAYATSTVARLINKENNAIIDTIKTLSGPATKIIHTSTLAVFGFALEKPVKTSAIKNRADFPYIVSKIHMENQLQKHFKTQPVSILRLGNIWGPASAGWTVKLADNLIYGKPVGADGFGYSNITDVNNAADYIAFLITTTQASGTVFYHLAELGHTSWKYWVDALAEALNAEPVLTGKPMPYHNSLMDDLAALKRFFSPSPMLFGALETRFLSFYLRNFISGLPKAVKKPFNNLPANYSAGNDFVYLTIMSGNRHFTNITHPGWKPPVNEEESLHRVLTWMQEAGYLVKNK